MEVTPQDLLLKIGALTMELEILRAENAALKDQLGTSPVAAVGEVADDAGGDASDD